MTRSLGAEVFRELEHTDPRFEHVQEVYGGLQDYDISGLDASDQTDAYPRMHRQRLLCPSDPQPF
jgi:hypothetical protein